MSKTRAYFLIFSWCASVAAAAAPGTLDESVVVMSPLEVSANSVDFKDWRKFASPNFVVYTDAGRAEAIRAIREFEMQHMAAQWLFRRNALKLPPMMLVLPTLSSDWRKIESKGGVQWKVAVSGTDHGAVSLSTVQYDWQDRGLWIVRAGIARADLLAMNLEGPLWFRTGVAKFFETTEFDGNKVSLGRQNVRTRRLLDGWLDWDVFFKVTTSSPLYTLSGNIDRYSAQSAAFLQYLLANPDPGWLERLIEWVAVIQADREPSEAEFRRIFGQSWNAWQRTMEDFLDGGQARITTIQVPPALTTFVPTELTPPVTEMRELFVLAQVINQKVPASGQALDSILAKGLKTPALREVLVEACIELKRRPAAAVELQKLIDAGSANPAVFTLAAAQLFADQVREPTLEGRLGEADAGKIRDWCQKALEIEPRDAKANNLLAWTEALAAKPDPVNDVIIERIYRALHGEVATDNVVMALAVAHLRNGDMDGARLLAQTLLDSRYTGKLPKALAGGLLKALANPP